MSTSIHYNIDDDVLHLSSDASKGILAHCHQDDPDGPREWPWSGNRSIAKVVIEDEVVMGHDASFLLSNLPNLTSIEGLENLDTSHVTDMRCMFADCRCLTKLDLSSFDTSNVTDMSEMFAGLYSLTSIEGLGNLDTSHVADMSQMFYYCHSLASLDLSGWDVRDLSIAEDMFRACANLKSLDLSGWDTSHVTDMSGMFLDCTSLEALAIGGWTKGRMEEAGLAVAVSASQSTRG